MRIGRTRQEPPSLLVDHRASGGLRPLPSERAARIFEAAMIVIAVAGLFESALYVPVLTFGALSDAWVIARAGANVFVSAFGGVALALVTALRLKSAIDRKRLARFQNGFSGAATTLLIAAAVAVLAGEALAFPLLHLFNPGKVPDVIQAAGPALRILIAQTIFLFFAAIHAGELLGTRLYHRAVIPVAAASVVAPLLFAAFSKKIAANLVGVSLFYLLTAVLLSVALILLSRRVTHYQIMLRAEDRERRQFLRLAVPAMAAAALFHLNGVLDIAFAGASLGVATVLDQAKSVARFLAAAVVLPITGVVMPVLTQWMDERQDARVRTLLTRAMRRALYRVTPFAAALAVMPEDTARVLFQWGGAIPEAALADEAALLRLFALPLLLATVLIVYAHAFLAMRQTRVFLLLGVVSAVAHPLFSYLFVRRLNFGVRGIPVAWTLTLLLGAVLMGVLYRAALPEARLKKMTPFAVYLLLCTTASVIVLIGLNAVPLWSGHKALQILIYAVKFLIMLFVNYVTGIVLRFREALETQSVWRERLKLGPVRGEGR